MSRNPDPGPDVRNPEQSPAAFAGLRQRRVLRLPAPILKGQVRWYPEEVSKEAK